MKITIIVLITVAVIEQLSFGVNGCNKDKENKNGNGNTKTPAANNPKAKAGPTSKSEPKAGNKPKPSNDIKTLPNGITFNIKDLLGSGQSADVYEGRKRDGTKVAVKVFKTDTVSIDSYLIELECYRKMGALNGDKCTKYGIPEILYHGDGGGSKVLAMRKYKSSVYKMIINGIYISVESWLSIIQQMVVTIKFMHSKGVIHGDIHDENMLAELNQIILIDFGLNLFEKLNEAHDILKMFLSICDYLNLKQYLKNLIQNVGMRVGAEKERIIREIKSKNVIHPDYARPITEFFIIAVFANLTKRPPDYGELYDIMDRALYPRGYNGQQFFFNWLTDEEKAAASKVVVGTIDLTGV